MILVLSMIILYLQYTPIVTLVQILITVSVAGKNVRSIIVRVKHVDEVDFRHH